MKLKLRGFLLIILKNKLMITLPFWSRLTGLIFLHWRQRVYQKEWCLFRVKMFCFLNLLNTACFKFCFCCRTELNQCLIIEKKVPVYSLITGHKSIMAVLVLYSFCCCYNILEECSFITNETQVLPYLMRIIIEEARPFI